MWPAASARGEVLRGEEEQELLQASEDDLDIRHGWQHMASVVKVAIVGVFAVCVVSVLAMSAESRSRTFNEASVQDTVGLDEQTCTDTPNWINGYTQCMTNGYKGKGCTPTGLTCEAYKSNGWCANGKVLKMQLWVIGEKLNYPELNCCVCGGGSRLQQPVMKQEPLQASVPVLGGLSPGPVPAAQTLQPLNPFMPPTASCSLYSLCVLAGVQGNCCPAEDGTSHGCCASPQVCRSKEGWTNSFFGCERAGVSKDMGCTPSGITCAGYAKQGFCKDGRVVPGKEWTLGPKFNFPEQNCCECGKPPGL